VTSAASLPTLVQFTLWPSLTENEGGHTELTWPQFLAFVSSPVVADTKPKLEGWSPARFAGNVRAAKNVEAVSCIVLDDDSSGFSFDEIVDAWSTCAGVVHTSHSHTELKPKFRIVLRGSRDMTAAEHAIVWAWCNDRGPLVDQATKDASRFWFVPAHREGAPYEWAELAGVPLDVDAILGVAQPVQQVPDRQPPTFAALGSNRRTAMSAALASSWPAKGRHEAQLALAGALRTEGWPAEDALEFLVAVAGERSKREKTIAHTYSHDGNLTGWTRLKSFVDPVVVDAVRGALNGTTELASRLLPNVEPPAQESTEDDDLGIVWGGWHEPVIIPPYLVQGLIPSGSVTTFFAEGGSVKSWAAFALGIAVATGKPWLGEYHTQQGRVLILDYEDGREEFKRRFRILTQDIVPLPDLGYRYSGINLLSRKTWEVLVPLQLKLVIVDTLGASMPGDADENATQFAEAVKLAGNFATVTGCTTVFVHHANKSGGMRGTTAVRDASDCTYKFEPVSESETEKRMQLVCDKPGPQKKPKPVNIVLTDMGLGTFKDEPPPTEPTPEEKARTAILSTLKANPAGVGKTSLLAAINVKSDTKRQVLAQLGLAGLVMEIRQKNEVICLLRSA
jgi:hypothetical protein